jgi:hypothetical protein
MKNRAERRNIVRASQATSDTGKEKEAASTGYADLIAFQNDNVDALVRFHKAIYDDAVEWSNDLLDFTGRHLQKQWNGAGWQLDGAAPLEAAASHLRYCQSSAEQYLEQTAKFLTLAAEVSRDSRAHLENHATTMFGHPGRDRGVSPARESAAPSGRTVPAGRRTRR